MYSRIEHLVRSLWLGRFGWSNRMAMYSAYFDESGHPDRGPQMVVAGCVADVRQWVHFEREWKDALKPFDVNVFHSTDFYQRSNPKVPDNPFKHLSDVKAKHLIDLLAGIICRRVERTFSGAVPIDEYNIVNKKYLFAEWIGYPYPLAARSCMGHVQMWAEKYSIPQNEILYFFEDGAKHKGQLLWIAEKDRLPEPRFEKKSEVVPLQAGDFLAWHWNAFLHGALPRIADSALKRLAKQAEPNQWNQITFLDDPDCVPTIFSIPLRDPLRNYKCTIRKQRGKRIALVHSWSKELGAVEPAVNRKTLTIPDAPTPLDGEGFDRALAAYRASRGSSS